MNMNVIGAIVGAAALVAIFYFGSHQPTPNPVQPKPPVVPVKPTKPESGPVVYHRVEEGGKQGEETKCTSVKPLVEGKTAAELTALAKKMGVTVEDLKRYYICNQD